MATRAASPHTGYDHRKDCPFSDANVETAFEASLASARGFSAEVLRFLAARPDAARAQWVTRSVEAGRALFQPWSMEILFVLAAGGTVRFTQLQMLLGGVSSRTLSDKLQTLRAEGLVAREVHDEQPVRIEYFLTRGGKKAAALATPLFAFLNHRHLEPDAP